jgi:hypothetical protein
MGEELPKKNRIEVIEGILVDVKNRFGDRDGFGGGVGRSW